VRGSRISPVGAADGSAHAEAAFSEVEPVADASPDAVVRHPEDVRLVDAALVEEVLDQTTDWVVDERGDDRRVEPEAAAQPARDVVLAPALPDAEAAGRGDSTVARVEPEHHLAEGNQVPAALRLRPDRERSHRDRPTIAVASSAKLRTRSNSPARSISGFTIQLPPHASTWGSAR
jgi:hypothetical protein